MADIAETSSHCTHYWSQVTPSAARLLVLLAYHTQYTCSCADSMYVHVSYIVRCFRIRVNCCCFPWLLSVRHLVAGLCVVGHFVGSIANCRCQHSLLILLVVHCVMSMGSSLHKVHLKWVVDHAFWRIWRCYRRQAYAFLHTALHTALCHPGACPWAPDILFALADVLFVAATTSDAMTIANKPVCEGAIAGEACLLFIYSVGMTTLLQKMVADCRSTVRVDQNGFNGTHTAVYFTKVALELHCCSRDTLNVFCCFGGIRGSVVYK